jgi:hypothetical protein
MANYARIEWTDKGHPVFESYFTTWDVGHYIDLVQNGYRENHKSCAFYPLWPLSIRWCSICAGGHCVLVGMVLSNISSLAGFFTFFHLVVHRFGQVNAWHSLILLLLFPGSLFFQFPYSEGLFFFLLMLLCLALERNDYKIAAMTGFLLPLTRAVGVLCVVPLTFRLGRHLYVNYCRRHDNILHTDSNGYVPSFARRLAQDKLLESSHVAPRDFVLLAAPICGLVTYLALMWLDTGNPLEGFRAQRNWGVQSIGNLFDLPKFLRAFSTPTTLHGFTGSLVDRCAFVFLLYCLPLIWRLDRSWFVWTCVLGIVPAMSGGFTSFIRFMSLVFPAFVALAIWLRKPGRACLRLIIYASFILLHLLLVWRFVNFEWAG